MTASDIEPQGPAPTGADPEGPPPGEPDDGVDVSLIRWFLRLTPAERLDHLEGFVNAALALGGDRAAP